MPFAFATGQSLISRVMSDLDGWDNDAKVLKSGSGGLVFRNPARPCPDPAPCNFPDGMTCTVCRKRARPWKETAALLELSTAISGGMPIERDAISYEAWVAMGHLRKRIDPKGLI